MSAFIQTTIVPKIGNVYVARQTITTFMPEVQKGWDSSSLIKEMIIPVNRMDFSRGELVMFLGYLKERDIIPEASIHQQYECIKLLHVVNSQVHYMKSTLIFAGDTEDSIRKRVNHQFSWSFSTLEEHLKTKKPLQPK